MYALWRQDDKGLKDLQEVINTQGLHKQVCWGGEKEETKNKIKVRVR